jgi:branched-chain amino acid transport system substrate-binding protein
MSKTPIKVGYCLSLSGGLAANGQTARLAHQVWQERANARGGLLGRDVELICVDDKSDATTVAGIYEKLLSEKTPTCYSAGTATTRSARRCRL